MKPTPDVADETPVLDKRLVSLDDATRALAQTADFGKTTKLRRVLEQLRRVLLQPGGAAAVQARARELEEAGVFLGTDWATPEILVPSFVGPGLHSGDADTVVMEATSELRTLAVASGDYEHSSLTPEDAREFLSQVLAMNLELLFTPPTEAERTRQGRTAQLIRDLFRHVADVVGYDVVLDKLVEEIWRVLRQRPIQVDQVASLITRLSIWRGDPDVDLSSGQGLDRLITALFGTTEACRDDPGVDVFRSRLEAMDTGGLQYEASGFARAMHDTGLVSPYHAELLQFLRHESDYLIAEALGVSDTGKNCLLRYRDLVHRLIEEAVTPQTAQCIYGLALLLDRGILYEPPVVPSLWRQIALELSPAARERLVAAFGGDPAPEVRLLAGVLSMLGQPLGIGQGDNPTCQSARALSMWAYNDPDYLLQMVVWAARDDEIIMHFEGQRISSQESGAGVAQALPVDLDPVSLVVVPHLDRIYAEMGRRCADRPGDPHRWVNPEFHGWWAHRGFHIDVDVATGNLVDLDDFLRQFHAGYHPAYNGAQPLIHPQPAGVAVTDSAARYVGWHAITILRVAPDPQDVMRVYFYNPNNDSGQDWGDGVVVSTAGNGERFGEASLPFDQFASRLYIFHVDPLERGEPEKVPDADIAGIIGYIERSWGADRLPAGQLQATEGTRPV
ncbi:hypothetical protein Ae168Ps1_3655 [Pseudonocardia sp. Ae168_Ps1]|uniref:hypothetical protein n=1 Tax=unclassified Pseudonocardia TaxID=2619320 RepID=UPI00094AE43E|nr:MULTISPECIES: hypothetical protein [unclassified Pseudonocardia]OLL75255.1 hypothetical protein Ae150APs1_3633 [Pseudonocardia sp. Ae150A_Ps1]OLL81249.1 hypothetical protein Ae168Ps1_3655 [Pseudonocardia sp. Ae168_Ps1]OLL84636.1 hypothetical protein Ae263Ps1_1691c [Pseudonocardia sp. Ae263_Ps1]OLL95347.1 hypothetical protein Ae356Ps1_5244 [Pseudonocardia sp. Ae356_Ps1]